MKKMTADEWNSEGQKLFGNKRVHWKFRCPGCDRVQTAMDFLKYRAEKVSPGTALVACKGNYEVIVGPQAQAPCKFNTLEHTHEDLIIVINDAGKEVPTFPFAS